MNFVWFTTFARAKMFWQILNLNYQNFLCEFWNSHDSLCLKMGGGQPIPGKTIYQTTRLHTSKNQLCIFRFFCPAFISHISMLRLGTTSALAGLLSCLFAHTHTYCLLSWNMNCYRLLKHVKPVDKTEGRAASTNSCNSKPSAPSICKFQAVHICEGSVTSCLFICGLLNGALDSREWIDGERKVVTVHVIKVRRGSRSKTSLFLNLGTRWHYTAGSFTL